MLARFSGLVYLREINPYISQIDVKINVDLIFEFSTSLITDLVDEQEVEMGRRDRRSLLDIIAIGAGVGLTIDSPDFSTISTAN
ncbi:MAG: hypothetical protein SAL07_20360 [Oscillatoria sp. PMC 1051.18]|nr:hypothetical protein [Oscillatoria sp. PMC 1051.18]